jgi:hypothetical protein
MLKAALLAGNQFVMHKRFQTNISYKYIYKYIVFGGTCPSLYGRVFVKGLDR